MSKTYTFIIPDGAGDTSHLEKYFDGTRDLLDAQFSGVELRKDEE